MKDKSYPASAAKMMARFMRTTIKLDNDIGRVAMKIKASSSCLESRRRTIERIFLTILLMNVRIINVAASHHRIARGNEKIISFNLLDYVGFYHFVEKFTSSVGANIFSHQINRTNKNNFEYLPLTGILSIRKKEIFRGQCSERKQEKYFFVGNFLIENENKNLFGQFFGSMQRNLIGDRVRSQELAKKIRIRIKKKNFNYNNYTAFICVFLDQIDKPPQNNRLNRQRKL